MAKLKHGDVKTQKSDGSNDLSSIADAVLRKLADDACEELNRNPSIAELDEDQDPWKYVISHNLHRRHLTTSQRAMVASKLANMKQGEGGPGRTKVSNDTIAMDDAAKQLNVGRATVARAKQVQERGSEAVKQAVEQGKVPVSLAAKLVKQVPDKKEQNKIISKGVEEVRATVAPKPEEIEYEDVEDEPVKGRWWPTNWRR